MKIRLDVYVDECIEYLNADCDLMYEYLMEDYSYSINKEKLQHIIAWLPNIERINVNNDYICISFINERYAQIEDAGIAHILYSIASRY